MSWLWPVGEDRQEESYVEPAVTRGRVDRAHQEPALGEALYTKEHGTIEAGKGRISCGRRS